MYTGYFEYGLVHVLCTCGTSLSHVVPIVVWYVCVDVDVSCTVTGSGASSYGLLVQDGRLNCLLCAARYGRAELFHHLVEKYGCDPKEKDKIATVNLSYTYIHTQRSDLFVFQCHCTLSCYVYTISLVQHCRECSPFVFIYTYLTHLRPYWCSPCAYVVVSYVFSAT